ncbi:flavin reductase family protein [Indiicoccus explosivorum]|uniref:flavin reductase family protein n=1 Tax=Indiicoccus explosivorum TaxID=1917864 RepID=UPI000B43CA78|nr:flavin reductase family protein [Indiicoccus explosivorum]
MIIDPKELSPRDTYKLLIGSVVPRPIAWVSTLSKSGVRNLAPYSFFNVVSRNPPMLGISIGEGTGTRKGTVKDTLTNIRETGEFVVNIVTSSMANEMAKSAETLPPEADEFDYADLPSAPCEAVAAPRIAEAPVSMECKLHDIIPLGSDHLVIGEMVRFHIKDDLYENGRINLAKLAPIGRLAGNYSLVETLFSLPNEDLGEIIKRDVEDLDKRE